MAHNLARWTARIGLGEQVVTNKTLRRRFFSIAGRLTGSARRLTLHLPQRWPWETQFSRAPRSIARPCHSRPDGAAGINADVGLTRPLDYPTASQTRARLVRERSLALSYPAISLTTATVGRHRRPQKRLQTAANLPSTRIRARIIAPVTPSPPFHCPHAVHPCPSVESGLGH